MDGFVFNPPPGWPPPPPGWTPPKGWKPDPSWPPVPPGWPLWIPESSTDPVPSPAQDATAPPPEPPATMTAPQISSTDDELRTLRVTIADLQAQLLLAQTRASSTCQGLVDLDDERVLQEVGIYRYHHPLEDSAKYRDKIRELQERMKEIIKAGQAILSSDTFTFNNSLAKGRKMMADLSKLMLRAYNAEADNCVRSLRAGNVTTAKNRLQASVTSIAKLGAMMEMRVNPAYHALRIEEIELTADFQMKVQEEREHAREERERLREERKAELEIAAQREKLVKERTHYFNALTALRANGEEIGCTALEEKLAALNEAIAQNDFRAANIRAGYVYVISNRGAFGRNMVKIGMTRRLEPLERVRELGDASVPFPFDLHALFFSEDAVTVENDLHHAFAALRVNMVNERREFFFSTPEQVRAVLAEKVGNLLEFTLEPESAQYLQSKKYWPTISETAERSTGDQRGDFSPPDDHANSLR